MDEGEINDLLMKTFKRGIDEALKGNDCPYKRENNQGQPFCSAVGPSEDIYEMIKGLCPYVGERREVFVVTRFAEDVGGIKGLSKAQREWMDNVRTSEGKKIIERIYGSKEHDIHPRREYSCHYNQSK